MSPVWQPPAASGGGAVATDVIWDTKGDLAAATGADAAVKVAAGANGTVLTADSAQSAGVLWNVPPGTVVDYTAKSSNTTISATTIGTANIVVSGAGFTPNGTDSFWIEFFAPRGDTAAAAGAQISMIVFDNGSQLLLGAQSGGTIAQVANPASAAFILPLFGKVKVTPTNAAHTYDIRGMQSGGNGLVAGGGGFQPCYILITKAA